MAEETGPKDGIIPEASADEPVAPDPQPPVPPKAPEKPPAQILSNDDIEGLLASLDADGRGANTPESIDGAPEEATAANPANAPADAADTSKDSSSQVVSNDDIDALLAAMDFGPSDAEVEPPKIPDEAASALVEPTPPEAAAPAGKQSTELLSNADLESLMASMNAKPGKAVEPPAAEEPVVERAPPEAPAPAGKQTTELLSNADLDSLIASLNSSPGKAVEPSGTEEPVAAPTPPEAPAPAGKQTTELLNNADLDSLIASLNSSPGKVVEPPAADEPMVEPTPPEAPAPASKETSEVLDNSDIESLLASLNSDSGEAVPPPAAEEPVVEPTPPEAPAPTGKETSEVLDNSDLESLLASLEAGSDEPDAPREEQEEKAESAAVADSAPATKEQSAEATASVPAGEAAPISQDLIESLVRGARHRQGEPERVAPPETAPRVDAIEEAVVPEDTKPALPAEERPSRFGWLSSRLAASVAIGFFSGACVYLYLASHPYRTVDSEGVKALRVTVPDQALGVATGLAEGDRYSEARHELEPVLSSLPPGEARLDAEFLDTEAAYHLLPDEAKIPVLKELLGKIDRLLTEAPNHPKARDATIWKADLLRRSDMPEAAYEVYKEILTQPDNPPGMDRCLLDAAETAMRLQLPNDAIDHLRRLMQAFPASPLRDEGEFRLGEAYLASGDMEAGRMTLMSVAKAHPDSALGAEAFARLGGLSYDAGDYDEAIRLFETRLQTATKVEGNDKIYLLLAKAHRVKGDLTQAERVLRELVDFFPESEQIPPALVELSQVLDGLGRRDEAVAMAKQAAQQYADNPEVLANAGRFLAEAGEASAGADTLVAAEHAGADNPALLLEAARQYRTAKELDKATEIYQRILDDYPSSGEALRAGIELARVDYEKGRIRAALERMERNVTDSKGRPGHPVALDALASLYGELGLRNRATEASREMAGETSDPVMLARAATTLFDAGEDKDAQVLAGRIDKGALPEPLAYGLLMREGEALATSNPEQALALMEQAYQTYPNDRRPEDVRRLLDSYLALDRTAAARALVVDAIARSKANAAEIPTLESAAARWGDHLYGRGDFTAAAEAYALAANAAGGDAKAARSENSLWSRFQQANCVFQLEDLPGSLPLFEEVASTTSRWSDLARAKADYVTLEMRRRGIVPVEPAPAEAPAQPVSQG